MGTETYDTTSLFRHITRNQSITMAIKPQYSRIKRNKLIKALIEYGYSKKQAKLITWNINQRKMQYGKIYSMLILTGGDLSFLNFTNIQIKR